MVTVWNIKGLLQITEYCLGGGPWFPLALKLARLELVPSRGDFAICWLYDDEDDEVEEVPLVNDAENEEEEEEVEPKRSEVPAAGIITTNLNEFTLINGMELIFFSLFFLLLY